MTIRELRPERQPRSNDGASPHRDALYERYLSADPSAAQGDAVSLAPYIRKIILPHLPPQRSAAILDLACGSGTLVAFLRASGYREVAGIDRSPEQVQAAAARGVDGVAQAEAFAYLSANQGAFDAICAIDALEHFTKGEAIRLLCAARDALRPGGHVIVQTCNASSPLFGRIRYGDLTHETAFTRRSIGQAFVAAGLAPVGVWSIDPPVHGARSLVRAAAWACAKAVAKAYIAIETGSVRGEIVSQNLIAVAERRDA